MNAASDGRMRRGVGIGAMWYGIGNTSLPNPSTVRIGARRDGTYVLFSGAQEIGQGSNTVMAQIAADTLAAPLASIALVRRRFRGKGPVSALLLSPLVIRFGGSVESGYQTQTLRFTFLNDAVGWLTRSPYRPVSQRPDDQAPDRHMLHTHRDLHRAGS